MNIQLQFYTLLLGFASCIISNVVLYGLSKNRTVHFKGKKHIDKFSISMRLKSRILINKRQTCIEKIFPPQVNYINMKYTRHISLLAQLYYIYLCVQQPLHFSNEHIHIYIYIYIWLKMRTGGGCGLGGMADIVVAFDLMTWAPDVWQKVRRRIHLLFHSLSIRLLSHFKQC